MDPELSGRVFMLERRGVAAAAGSPEARLMQGLRSALTPEQHPLRVVAGEDPPNEQIIRALVEANTGSARTINAAGAKVRVGGEITRFAEGNNWAAIYSQILRGDITPALAANPLVQQALESVIRSDATLAAQYDALPPGDRQLVLRNQLRSGKLKAEIAQLLTGRAAPGQLLDDQTGRLNREVQQTEQRVQELEKERQALQKEIEAVRKERSAFQATNAGGVVTQGEYSQELARLKGERAPATAHVEQVRTQLSNLNALILERENSKGRFVLNTNDITVPQNNAKLIQFDNDINDLKGQRTKLEAELRTQQQTDADREVRIQAIDSRKTSVDEALTGDASLTNRLQEVQRQLGDVNSSLSNLREELRKALSQREIQESQFIGSLASILPEAAVTAINERLDQIVQQQHKVDQAATNETQDASERTLRERIAAMFNNAAAPGQVDWVTFDQAWNEFLSQGSDRMFTHPAFGILTGTGITIDELRSHPKRDELTTALKEKMARYRMARPRRGRLGRLQAGPEPLSRNEILAITNQFDDEYYNRVIAANTTLREQVNRACNDGVLNFTGRWGERLRGLPMGNILMVLALLLGGGALLSTTGVGGAAAGALGIS